MSELGLPGDLIGEDEKRNPEQWRVGGRPCLPQTLHWTGQDACKVCGSKSSFVLQVFLVVEGISILSGFKLEKSFFLTSANLKSATANAEVFYCNTACFRLFLCFINLFCTSDILLSGLRASKLF